MVERARNLLALVSGPVFLAPSFGSPSQVARALCKPAQLLSGVTHALYAPTQPLLSNYAELAFIPKPDSTIALRCDCETDCLVTKGKPFTIGFSNMNGCK